MDKKKELIEESVKSASQILAFTMQICDLKTHINGKLDFGDFGMFELKFTKIEGEKNLNEATVKRSELIDFVNWLNDDGGHIFMGIEKMVDDYLKSINSNGA